MSDYVVLGVGWKLGHFVRSWKQRVFVVAGHELRYYSTADDIDSKIPRGVIPLNSVTSVHRVDSRQCSKQPAFVIVVNDKTSYYIHAKEDSKIELWMASIHAGAKASHAEVTPLQRIRRHSMDNFVNFSAIHQSEFATVKRAHLKEDNKVCAIKCLDKALLARDDLLVQAELECEVLSHIACPYIVPVRDIFYTETSIVQVFEYMRGGTLFRRILEEERIPESRARLYAAEILFALHYLHSKGIVHRNLRPENVLLDEAGHAMLSNFALVKTQMYTAKATATDFCGSDEYIAPEILTGQPHTRAVD
jgi:hypothetical protein